MNTMTEVLSPENALVAKVAAQRVARDVEVNPGTKSLFRIVGLDNELTCAVARRIAHRIPDADVFVHVGLSDGSLPDTMLTTENATHFRNDQRPTGGGAIVFAVPTHHLDVVGATVGEIQQVSERTLLDLPNLWIECSDELSKGLDERGRQNLANVFRGIAQAGILVGGLRMFGDFVHQLETHYRAMPLHRALDEAIPALRIPKGAGRFKEFAAKGRLRTPEKWAEIFKEIHSRADDALHLRNDRGTAFERSKLRVRIQDMKTDALIDETEADILDALVSDEEIEPGNWTPAQELAISLKWETIEKLTKTTKSEKLPPLGEATISFFDNNMPNELSPSDRKILEAVVNEADDADDEERDFFFRQRDNMKEDKRLLKRWERCVFRKTEEQADLALGLFVAIADLVDASETLPSDPKVVVRLQGADKKTFWTKEHNSDLCRFLRDRYRGLPQVMASVGVHLDFGMCWTVPWDNDDSGQSKTSVSARQFKFDIAIISSSDMVDGKPSEEAFHKAAHSTQLIWSMPGNSFASSYSVNMQAVANTQGEKALLASGRFSRAQASDRSTDGRIDLGERSSIQDAFQRPDGVLVDANDTEIDAGRIFETGLENQRGNVLSEVSADDLRVKFQAFRDSYSTAVRAMVCAQGKGLAEPALFQQAKAYGELLRELRRVARKDDCRAALWRSMLSVGIAHAIDRPAVAICAPWHPFRLAESSAKAMRLASALGRILSPGSGERDIRTFSRTVARSVSAGWLPGVILFPDSPKPRLLIETENFADFGLMEPPTVDQGAENAFDGYSKQATQELIGVADEFLELQPHERSNFSVVLYNADNRDLPSRLADRLARKIENEKDLRCDLILTHTDQQRLRQIYSEQNVAISRELDGALSNEATQGFLSRLRVGFLDVGDLGRGDSGVHASDIVFLHDVIARSAGTNWRRVEQPEHGWPEMSAYMPGFETRRRYFEKGTRKTEVLLVSAERPEEVQDYLNLVRDYHQDSRDAPDGHYVPVREINFDEDIVGKAIDHAHKVGRWVVTYDAIADLQLFKNNNVSIIRFLTKPCGEHNLIVSTRHHGMMLLTKLAEEIGTILGTGGREAADLAKNCVDEAAKISGRVVLRAARLENNALELLGLVLSKQVIVDSLPEGVTPVAWLLLDDYADWLGHRGQKADILVFCLGEEDGIPTLDLIVVESKFVGMAAETACMAESMAQMRASTNDLRDRIVQDKDLLNRPTWLGRLADLLLEHGLFPEVISGRQPPLWARLIRSDEAVLRIRGLSLVFTHDRTDPAPEPLERHSAEQAQYVFNRADVAMALKRVQSECGSVKIVLPPPATAATATSPEPTEPLPATVTVEAAGVAVAPVSGPAIPTESVAHMVLPPTVKGFSNAVQDFLQAHSLQQEKDGTAAWLEQTKTKLRMALRGYSLDADIVGDRLTPNAALVRFKGTDKMTVSEVEKRKEILLTSHGLDVIGVRPERGEVVVMVARDRRAILDLRQAWLQRTLPETAPRSNSSFLLGERENDGALLYLNLGGAFAGQPQHGPHTLIAGETGGGKGVLTRNIILDICATNNPREARIRMVDPKNGGDYPWIDRMPHLDGGLVTTQAGAIDTLKELVETMETRYREITPIAPNIDRYNAKVRPEQRLPRIYFFHDELGDWMADRDNTDYRDAVESYVVRLASKARAAGIHLFLITQRPDKDALPGQIKANMNNKICLRVSSQTNSRIVLDENGAENLLGHGHFAAKLANERPSNQTSLIFAQSPYLDDDDADEMARAIRQQWHA